MSSIMKSMLLTAALLMFSAWASAEGNPEMKADAQAIDSACKADAATAGCGNEVVGKGLLKCIHEYKESHKDFKVSEGCRESMKKMREDRKEEGGHMNNMQMNNMQMNKQ